MLSLRLQQAPQAKQRNSHSGIRMLDFRYFRIGDSGMRLRKTYPESRVFRWKLT
jgi:hypothetical protein